MRALQATNMATTEADRLFAQGQTGIQNQGALLQSAVGQQQNAIGNFTGLETFNRGVSQQQRQNALGFGGGAGTVLNPNFQTLTAVLNASATDQASRAGVSSNSANILANAATARGDQIGNSLAGFAQGFSNFNQGGGGGGNLFGGSGTTNNPSGAGNDFLGD